MNTKQNIISIVGTTATGKTDLALKIAAELLRNFSAVDIISADSRQVYQEIEITSGADVPEGFFLDKSSKHQFPFFTDKSRKIRMHGISIIKPVDEWSISHFQDFARKIITESRKNDNFVILVGGTGLYHQYLFDFSSNFSIPPNQVLRQKIEKLSVAELQDILRSIDTSKLNAMNNSDLNNSRRLIRAIETTTFLKKKLNSPLQNSEEFDEKILTFGMIADLETLEDIIKSRVKKRLEQGALQEVKNLMKKYPEVNSSFASYPITSTLGFQEMKDLLDKKIDFPTCINVWALKEFQYAKRQITWWKKKENITYLKSADISQNIDRLLEQIALY